ncbi:MAG: sugar ABC transporter ATP-binding protein [Rhizobiaceae bacterium]|nr:sugar ABC transporter ATP-binding protein [Rhizobiaceae bacterium]
MPLEFAGLSKRYGPATVLDDVTLRLGPGRVHALMGENGAGKSTFIKLLAGVVPADAMTVWKDGHEVQLRSAADATAAGFRFIHQELNTIPQLSVAENILLGQDMPLRLGLVNWTELARRAKQALAALGVEHINVTRHAGALGTGDRMLIKIASALVSHDGETPPCLYVFDEPTAALNEAESEKLFAVIARLKEQGAAILYVSHRMEEVMRVCDDVTVLRNGRHVMSAKLAETSREAIILAMTGRDIANGFPARITHPGTDIVCELRDVSSATLSKLNFTLARGEVLGIAGLAGSGQTELLRLFLGLEKQTGGTARFEDADLPSSPSEAWSRGVAYVPQERRSEGLMMHMNVRLNTLLPHYTGWRARRSRENIRTVELSRRVHLKAEGPEQPVWQLSGGNQQKVVFARALGSIPRLLLLDEPTRGVDVGAKFEIYKLVRELSEQGCGVIMSSTDLPELLGMCDRILILSEGVQHAIVDPDGMASSDLLQMFYAADRLVMA